MLQKNDQEAEALRLKEAQLLMEQQEEVDRISNQSMKESKLVTTQRGIDFVKSTIPDFKPTTVIKLLYKGSRDGWQYSDFHTLCDNQGPTLTLFKSSAGKISGGFTSISWKTDNKYGVDAKALVFSVDQELKFPCLQPEKAVYHQTTRGPSFGSGYLEAYGMNKHDEGYCYFAGSSNDSGIYKVSVDGKGNSILTGEGGNRARFTCVELEVF